MALSNVTFILGEGGLARELPNSDHISCLIFDFPAPSNWVASGVTPMRSFRTLAQVEQTGITQTNVFGEVWYQCKEFFRQNSDGKLWLLFDHSQVSPSAIVAASSGEIRQYAFFAPQLPYSRNFANAWQGFLNNLADLDAPAVLVLGAMVADFNTLSSADYPRNQSNQGVLALVAGDGDAQGAALATSLGISAVLSTGAVCGALSAAAVHQSIAWVAEFNFANTELENPVFSSGDLLANTNSGFLTDLDEMGFTFYRKFVGLAGSYLNASNASITLTSDYAFIENSRTIQKAIRGVRAALLPQLNSPLYVQGNGRLRPDTVGFFKSKAKQPLISMQDAGELSGQLVEIDPAQNVLATGELEVQIELQPVGVARKIIVKLGFKAQIA
jgi:hypothetical protein